MKAGDSLIQRILKSAIFAKMLKTGVRLTKNKALLLVVLQQGLQKMENKGVAEGVRDVKDQLLLMIRFIKAYATGAYRDVTAKSMATVVGVLVYFISPLDLIPDVLPIIGIADDVALVVWMFKVLEREIDKFSDWEKRNSIKIG